jgi:hypothetical protein
MPTIVMSKLGSKIDPTVRKKAMAFLLKLGENDTAPGLHIEPIAGSADPRVRTGRVDQFYRAVLFKIPGAEDTMYVFHGIWPHDDAITMAKKTVLSVNPVNGVTEIRLVEPAATPAAADDADARAVSPVGPARKPRAGQAVQAVQQPLLERLGVTRADLVDELGLDGALAARALAAADEDELLAVAGAATTVEWQGLALIDLGSGHGVAEVHNKFALGRTPEQLPAPGASEDERLVQGLRRPAAQLSFTYIDGSEELRRVIEGGDFGAWRVFLHPEQRGYAERPYNGPFRLAGGAGTGKTVVVLHRARNLARRNPVARVLVTTFTTNLADAMRTDLKRLDPEIPIAEHPGDPGVYVTGIDALASAVLRRAQADLAEDVRAVLGTESAVGGRMASNPWREALDAAGGALPEPLRSEAFFVAEYSGVILPNRVTTKPGYLKVRRPGRGVALDRGKRSAVWDVVAACRAQARVSGGLDFQEAAAIAAAHLERRSDAGHLFDHVLVDEGQDLSPVHWQLLRTLVGEHPNDLFIAEDSHQRIYGRRVVLGQYGIKIIGRSRRLTLNYRTTAQTLAYALRILQGADYVDLEEDAEASADYRSARSGPNPQVLGCSSLAKELEAAAATVTEWVARTPAPETIAVLVRDRWQRDRVAAGLAERGVQIRSVDREAIKPGQPVVMTMHRAKGTEFSKVLLFGVSADSIPAAMKDQKYSDDAWQDALLRERSLLYVAATRARDELAVTYKGNPSTLVSPLGDRAQG